MIHTYTDPILYHLLSGSLKCVKDANDATKMEKAYVEAEKVRKLKTLFKGLKVFLNREVPREPLVFVLRCFGAEVSWDKDFFVGASFSESDETITHQIVDRPEMSKQYISRLVSFVSSHAFLLVLGIY